jgi:WD40 repeat protein
MEELKKQTVSSTRPDAPVKGDPNRPEIAGPSWWDKLTGGTSSAPPAKPDTTEQVAVTTTPAQASPPKRVPPATTMSPTIAKHEPPSPNLGAESAPRLHDTSWTAGASDIAAWRPKRTTWLGGSLSNTAVSLDRTTVAVTGEREGSLHVIDALTLKPRAKIMLAGHDPLSLSGIAILPENKRLAVVRNNGLEVYDIVSKARVQSIPQSCNSNDLTLELSLSKDGQHLYCIGFENTIQIYTVASGGLEHLTEHKFDRFIRSFDVTEDGGQFLLEASDLHDAEELVLYDARSRRIIWAQQCACSGKFGSGDQLIVFAGQLVGGHFDRNTFVPGTPNIVGVLDVSAPERRAIFNTQTSETLKTSATLKVSDVSPDGLLAAIRSTAPGHVVIVPVSLDSPNLPALTILQDNSGQSVSGAKFVGRNSLVTTSGDNNARLWSR